MARSAAVCGCLRRSVFGFRVIRAANKAAAKISATSAASIAAAAASRTRIRRRKRTIAAGKTAPSKQSKQLRRRRSTAAAAAAVWKQQELPLPSAASSSCSSSLLSDCCWVGDACQPSLAEPNDRHRLLLRSSRSTSSSSCTSPVPQLGFDRSRSVPVCRRGLTVSVH